MSTEFSKVLQSDWLRALLATCKNSEKYNIRFQYNCSQPGKKTEKTGQTENKHFTQAPYTQVQQKKPVLIFLKRLF